MATCEKCGQELEPVMGVSFWVVIPRHFPPNDTSNDGLCPGSGVPVYPQPEEPAR